MSQRVSSSPPFFELLVRSSPLIPGQAIDWYRADEGAGLLGATVGSNSHSFDLGRCCSTEKRYLEKQMGISVAKPRQAFVGIFTVF